MPIPSPPEYKRPRGTLRDVAYDALKSNILNGTLRPGERLDGRDLQKWLGISRTPIREALVMLDAEGLIDTRAQSATRVTDPDPALARDEVRAVGALIAGSIRQTIPALSDASAVMLVTHIDAVAEAASQQSAERTATAMQQLHEGILECCPNTSLVGIVARALTLLAFQLRATINNVGFEWEALRFSADALRDAVVRRDTLAAGQIIETMHFIPMPD